ncbi:MAG: IS3 family transposase [Clostridia bacterium]
MAIQYFTEKRQWNINWMCRQLEISRAAYYKWLHRPIPKQEEENINLAELIKEYDERFCHILGYRRMTSWINHFNHTNYSKNRIHRIMKKLGIHSVIRKKKKNIIFPNRRRLPKISSKEISMQENLMKNGLPM